MQPESSNTQNGSRHESVNIKTDHTDSDSVYNNNIPVLNEVSSISEFSLQPTDSVDVSSQYQDIQTPRLLDNNINFTPRSTMSNHCFCNLEVIQPVRSPYPFDE
eukprot:59906_1